MNLRRQIKKDAQRALRDGWGRAVAILLITAAVIVALVLFEGIFYQIFHLSGFRDVTLTAGNYLLTPITVSLGTLIITGFIVFIGFILLSPLHAGTACWYYQLVSTGAEDISSVFRFFSSGRLLLRSWMLYLQLIVRSLFWTVLFMAPGGVVLYFSVGLYASRGDSIDTVMGIFGIVIGILLLLTAALLLSVFLLRYFLAPYILADDQKLSARKCIVLSKRYMKGRKGQLWVFHLSFFPWMLLSLLILPLLYVLPYISCASALYAKYLIEVKHRQQETPKVVQEPSEKKTDSATQVYPPVSSGEEVVEEEIPTHNVANGDPQAQIAEQDEDMTYIREDIPQTPHEE